MRRPLFGRTALFWAAQRGHNEIVLLLLNKGADPRIASIRGNTPEMIARENNHPSTEAILKSWVEKKK